jgi:hypothetical protein
MAKRRGDDEKDKRGLRWAEKIILVYRSMIDHVCYTVYTIDCSEKLFGEKE